jgi:Mechanosensitive ion channel, beta-domain
MEQFVEGQWQQWALIKIAIVAIILFFVLRLVFKSLKILQVRYNACLAYQRYFPVIEMLVWISFIYWALEQTLVEPLYFTVFFITISVIGLIWIGWYAARDYIAGIILRAQDIYEEGQQLVIGDIAGIIMKLGYLNVELQKGDGVVLKVPYSKITGNVHYNRNENRLLVTHKFILKISSQAVLQGAAENIKKSILNSPWHASHIIPQIHKISENDGIAEMEIVVSTFGPESLEKLQLQLFKEFENK